jgi:hypothetical protein
MRSIIFILLFPIALFSNDLDSTKKSKILIGVNVAPNYTFRFLSSTDRFKWILKARNEESAAFRLAIGLAAKIAFNNRIDFELGFQYNDQGYNFISSNVVDGNTGDSLLVNFKYHYKYLDIPIKINYKFNLWGKTIFIDLGISPSVYLNYGYNFEVKYPNGKIIIGNESPGTEYTNLRDLNIFCYTGVGANFNLYKNWILKIEPIFSFSITSTVGGNSEVKELLYSAGINTGVYFKL